MTFRSLTLCIQAVLYGKVEADPERLSFLDEVYNRGCVNWDSSEGYADNEDLIGKWFAKTGKRKGVLYSRGLWQLDVHKE